MKRLRDTNLENERLLNITDFDSKKVDVALENTYNWRVVP